MDNAVFISGFDKQQTSMQPETQTAKFTGLYNQFEFCGLVSIK